MKIVVLSPSFSRDEVLRDELASYFNDVVFNSNGKRLGGRELIDFIGNADAIVAGLEKIDKTVIDACSNLKIVSKYGVGLDNVDCDYCSKKGVAIGWTPGVNKASVAEMTLGFMIMLSRNLFASSIIVKSGEWERNGGYSLAKKTVGIIGAGNIGKEVARLLKPFQCRILVNDIIDQSDYYRKKRLIEVSKEQIYREADYVTIHTPLTDKTEHMINKKSLTKMKRSAFLINTARGRIVRTDDLKWALQSDIIAGAAVDVFEQEPPYDMDFLGLPNLICTPHIGGNSREAVLAMGRSAIRHLKAFFKQDHFIKR